MIDGRVIHCLILDDGSFDEQFLLMPSNLPSDNTKRVVDRTFGIFQDSLVIGEPIKEFGEFSSEILEILKEINLHQSLKTDGQRIDKIVTAETKGYLEFLKIRGDKTLLDDETLARCNEAVTALRADTRTTELLGLLTHEMENVEIFNEQLMSVETDKPFGLKGVVDNLVINHDKKTIYINDLKTTGKTIRDFKETIEFYNYWAQAAIYWRLVNGKYDELIGPDWTVIFNFVVIDKYNQVYAFEVSRATMQEWQVRLEANLAEAAWHYTNRNYILPYEFATGKVIL